jgi:hypothetical protein
MKESRNFHRRLAVRVVTAERVFQEDDPAALDNLLEVVFGEGLGEAPPGDAIEHVVNGGEGLGRGLPDPLLLLGREARGVEGELAVVG